MCVREHVKLSSELLFTERTNETHTKKITQNHSQGRKREKREMNVIVHTGVMSIYILHVPFSVNNLQNVNNESISLTQNMFLSLIELLVFIF